MLDNDTIEASVEDEIITPEIEAEEESLEVTIEGEEPDTDPDEEIEAELGDRGKRALQAARKAAKDAAAEARAAKAELAASRAAVVVDEPELVEPTIEDCGYNEPLFKQKLRDFYAAEAKVEAKKQARIAEAQAETEDYQARIGKYVSAKTAMKVDDFDAAESMVRSKLTQAQQSIIIRNSDNPASTILALGRSKKALDDLASVKDPDRFAYALAKVEGKITVTTKTPPPPESKLRGGTSASGGSFTAQLAAAEKEAERTGDRSKIAAIRRDMKAAGVKV